MKKITILGATGSIGASTLSVIEHNRDDFSVYALAAHSNVDKMYQLCLKWQPEYAVMADHASALQLQKKLAFIKSPTSVLAGMDGLCEISSSLRLIWSWLRLLDLQAYYLRWQQLKLESVFY